jgi:hypothetical protein
MKPEELAEALTGLLAWAHENAPRPQSEVRRRLEEHLGADPQGLEVLTEALSDYDLVNAQVALEALGALDDVIGLSVEHGWQAGLADLASGEREMMDTATGPAEYRAVDVGDAVVRCLVAGLLFLEWEGAPLVALLSPSEGMHGEAGARLHAMAPDRRTADAWLARLRELMRERNVYRGKVISLGGGHPFRPAPLTVQTLPVLRRDQIVLPDAALERIERHTAGLARHRDALRAGGRHVRRGLLLHGPPGTGKTLTIMYLANLMPERTVVLLTGQSLGAVGAAAQLARSLEPSMVVVEDVDLIAQDRRFSETTPLLFELLNAMDGLDEDADIIFALTTNRADVLEPALVSRPGRIDLAVELPLPDAIARRRLLELYARGLEHEIRDWTALVAATDGVSPAFVKEAFRAAAVLAAEEGGATTEEYVLRAVADLRSGSGRLTAALLGAAPPALDEVDEVGDAAGDLDEVDDLDEDQAGR